MTGDDKTVATRGAPASVVRWLLAGFVVALAAYGIAVAALVLLTRPPDLWFYWEAGRQWPNPYTFRGLADFELFRYPPTSAALLAPLSNIPLAALRVIWFVVDLALLRWALHSWRLTAIVACLPPVAVELVSGNINILAGSLFLRAPWANGLLFAFAPKPYVALMTLKGGRQGILTLAAAAAFVLAAVALDGWRYLVVLGYSVSAEQGTFEPIRFGLPLYVAWVAAWLGLAGFARRTWVTALCAAMASPVVHLVYFCAAVMAFALALRMASPDVPGVLRALMAPAPAPSTADEREPAIT